MRRGRALEGRLEVVLRAIEIPEAEDEGSDREERRVRERIPLRRKAVEQRALVRDDHRGHRIEVEKLQLLGLVGEYRDREKHRREEVPGEQQDPEDVLHVAEKPGE